ncbi:hypothetical protein [Kocuria sp. NPDC057446]|uniref:hypothetical protein n=1 Tax=Kocuria sp. NPDC057446 TaxID=3346137 RepID=UPI003677929E
MEAAVNEARETDTGVGLIRRAMMFLAVALVVTVVVVAGLLLIGEVRWDEVVGFIEWFSRSTAFGAIIAGTLALTAAWLAYHGVQQTIRSTETREREKARHERFTTIVTQLASNQPAVRLGGLYAVSALADEWEREARRLISVSDSAGEWRDKERAWA